MGPRLDLRQSQSLVMTPQLQQAIKLLAMSNLELDSFVTEEIERNPLLDGGRDEGGDGPDTAEAPPPAEDRAAPTDTALSNDGGGDAASQMDVDYSAETFHHDGFSDMVGLGSGGSGSSGAGSEDGIDFDSFAGADGTLTDHLLAQAGETLSGLRHAIAVLLIERIDEAGYLDVDMLDVAQRLGVPLAEVEAALAAIHGFDPVGVGARDLAECLAIQAREADRYDPCMAKLIANLDLVARGALPQLKRLCGVDDEDMADMIRELRSYDPKPGLRFGGVSTIQSVTPDLFVRPTKAGWAVEVNSATLPRVLINRRYYTELARGAAATSKAWLSEQLASANWLVRALDQRQRTIVKVASEIVKQQEGFFLHGVSHMRALTLRQVADAIGMHESTVSRVTSNKYLSCPRGLFELKYFFSSGIQSANSDDAMSAEAVKNRIKALIDQEDGRSILSDDAMATILNKEGCDIARRTVVKYREAMGIGSSVQRRRQKALAG